MEALIFTDSKLKGVEDFSVGSIAVRNYALECALQKFGHKHTVLLRWDREGTDTVDLDMPPETARQLAIHLLAKAERAEQLEGGGV